MSIASSKPPSKGCSDKTPFCLLSYGYSDCAKKKGECRHILTK